MADETNAIPLRLSIFQTPSSLIRPLPADENPGTAPESITNLKESLKWK